MEILNKFDHDANGFSEALGINPERRIELICEIQREILKMEHCKSRTYENLIYKARNMGEVVFLVSQYTSIFKDLKEMMEDPNKAFEKIMRAILEE